MIYRFEDIELDTQQYELRSDRGPIRLEPQVFDVLAFLIKNRDRVVSKEELFEGVWGDRIVTESALSSRLKAARKAIGDSGREQRLIRTLHGRGYRFVGEVSEQAAESLSSHGPSSETESRMSAVQLPGAETVGRDVELNQLLDHLSRAQSGFRQLVLVTGEAGLGKTTLVETFLAAVRDHESTRLLHGHCLEHHGQGEAFLPVLEAIGRLCKQEGGTEVVELLRRRAPSWLIEMPWLVEPGELAELRHESRGMTRDRMLREMVESLEELTAERAGVLVLEDLHWSDPSTVDLLTYLANRSETARLMIIGTYRATDARAEEHPVDKVVERLKIRNLAAELPLSLLTEESTLQYLENRLPGADLPERLPNQLQQRTGGNPLFMGTVVDHWISESVLELKDGVWKVHADLDQLSIGVPESLRLLIERRLAALPQADLSILEAASVIGAEFPAAAVAAGVELTEDEIEERCSAMARAGTLVQECGSARWLDGTVSACFKFVHDVYQEVLYSRIPAGRRARLHGRIGSRLEEGYGGEARNRAAELAAHFIEAQNASKAVEYLLLASHQALRRFAQIEGIAHLNKGLGLLTAVEDESTRLALELSYQSALAPAMIAHEGLGSEAAEAAFVRARELAERLEDRHQQLAMIYGLAIQNELRGNFETSQKLMEERFELQKLFREETPLEVENYDLLACSHFHQAGYRESLKISEAGMEAFDSNRHSTIASRYGENPGIACYSWAALNLWFLGSPDQALEKARRAVELSEPPEQSYHMSNAKLQLALLRQFRQEVDETLRWANETIEQAVEQGFVMRIAMGKLLKGWALAISGEDRGFELLRDGLDSLAVLGAGMDRPYFLGLLADALRADGKYEEALEVVDEALGLIHPSRSHFYQSELLRLRGELMIGADPDNFEGAEQEFQKALDLSRSHQARAIELRTMISLSELYEDQERAGEARESLSSLVESFEEGFDAPDFVRANELLGEGVDSPT
jgi:predicted ATPase